MIYAYFYKIILSLLFLVGAIQSIAQDTLILSSQNQSHNFSFDQFKYYQDHTHQLRIQEIAWAEKQNLFLNGNVFKRKETLRDESYWMSFSIDGASLKNNFWYFKASNQQDLNLACFIQQEDGGYQAQAIERHAPSIHNLFQHQDYVVEIPSTQASIKLLVQVQTKHPEAIAFQLKTVGLFNKELSQAYLASGFFYGILCFIGCYCFFCFLRQREKRHLIYTLLVLSAMLWCSTLDGLGIRYFGYNFSQFHVFLSGIFLFLLLVSLVLYANSLLKTPYRQAKYFEILLLLTSISLIPY